MARIKTINFLSLLSFVILSKVIHLLLHIGFFAEPNLIDDGNEYAFLKIENKYLIILSQEN